MGGNTYESLPVKPLADRVNIVVSRRLVAKGDFNDIDKGLYAVSSTVEALDLANRFATDWVYFIGGAGIYEEAMRLVDRAHVTLVHKSGQYDTRIPNLKFPVSEWTLDSNHVTVFDTDPETGFPIPSHTYLVYNRLKLNHT